MKKVSKILAKKKPISTIPYADFEKAFLNVMDYKQFADGSKDYNYDNAFKSLIKRTHDFWITKKQTYTGEFEAWLKTFYAENKQKTHQIWVKK